MRLLSKTVLIDLYEYQSVNLKPVTIFHTKSKQYANDLYKFMTETLTIFMALWNEDNPDGTEDPNYLLIHFLNKFFTTMVIKSNKLALALISDAITLCKILLLGTSSCSTMAYAMVVASQFDLCISEHGWQSPSLLVHIKRHLSSHMVKFLKNYDRAWWGDLENVHFEEHPLSKSFWLTSRSLVDFIDAYIGNKDIWADINTIMQMFGNTMMSIIEFLKRRNVFSDVYWKELLRLPAVYGSECFDLHKHLVPRTWHFSRIVYAFEHFPKGFYFCQESFFHIFTKCSDDVCKEFKREHGSFLLCYFCFLATCMTMGADYAGPEGPDAPLLSLREPEIRAKIKFTMYLHLFVEREIIDSCRDITKTQTHNGKYKIFREVWSRRLPQLRKQFISWLGLTPKGHPDHHNPRSAWWYTKQDKFISYDSAEFDFEPVKKDYRGVCIYHLD